MSRRRLLAPEVVQTSAMDCGPASLKCLLDGHGLPVSYGRLREACQTDVDGTSIDTLESVACRLGLRAEQVMVPVDHLLCAGAALLPALVVVRQPDGMTHFVVAWRRHGRWMQVMDPALGRSWITAQRFRDDLYVHTMPVPAATWRAWAGSDGLHAPLAARLRAIGFCGAQTQAQLTAADNDPGWHAYAALDASARLVDTLVRSGGVRRGRPARRLFRATVTPLLDGTVADDRVPDPYWSVRPAPAADDGTPQVEMRGAILLQAHGRGDVATDEASEADERRTLPPELAAARQEAPPRPIRDLWRLLRQDGDRHGGFILLATVLTATVLAAVGVLVEALLLRSLFGLADDLGSGQHRLVAMAMLGTFLVALLGIQVPTVAGQLRLGRRLEARLRQAFSIKLPRLGDRYLQSRPVSDMAERSHALHQVRRLPVLLGNGLRTAFELVLTAAGIIWLDPSSAPLAIAAAGFALFWPLVVQPALTECDLRMQTHTGAMSRIYLDALLGLTTIRAHGAERAVQRAHEALLVAWAQASMRFQRAWVGVEGLQQWVGFGLAAWMLFRHLAHGERGTALLLIYWALHLPVLGQSLALQVRQYPMLRNRVLRLLEPLVALESPTAGATATSPTRESVESHEPTTPAAALSFADVRVRAGGHLILDGIDLRVPPGQHVAIVGRSGAGKSSLVGLLLGWHRTTEGSVLVDGVPLIGGHLKTVRRDTAWLDPAVQLWNTTLLDNVTYGCAAAPGERLGKALRQADVPAILRDLPDGLQTLLGEGGGRLSGGEGQRVRCARALLNDAPRLVLLDEPFRGLDHDRRRALMARTRAHWRHATLLCVSHDVGDTREMDRVLVMEAGRIVEDGAPADLLARPSRYRALVAEEEAVDDALWNDPRWRRLHLADGALTENPSRTPVGTPLRRGKLATATEGSDHESILHLADGTVG